MSCMVRLAALLALLAKANAVVIDSQGNVAGAKIVRREGRVAGMTGTTNSSDEGAADDEEAGGANPPAVKTDPAGFTYDYVEEGVPGACYAHYDFEGLISNDECAKRCYDTFGCTRFSNGGCDLGCRISVENKNPGGQDVSPDGQCITSEASTTGESDGHGCVLYQLSFFHAVSEPSSCAAHYELHADAKNKAECAHKCKNTEGCKTFSAEPNCMDGCRISKCGHHGGTEACAADGQCTLATSTGCVTYEVFR